MGVIEIILARRDRNVRVELYAGGFVFADDKARQEIRWEDIVAVYRKTTQKDIEASEIPIYKWNV